MKIRNENEDIERHIAVEKHKMEFQNGEIYVCWSQQVTAGCYILLMK